MLVSYAQPTKLSIIPLRIVEQDRTESSLGYGMSMPTIGDGGFYAQLYSGYSTDKKIYWINLKGQKRVALDLSRLSLGAEVHPEDVYILDYAVDPQSGIDVLILWHAGEKHVEHSAIVRFDTDGDLRGMVPLKIDFHPTHFAPFLSGSYALIGFSDKAAGTVVMVVDDQGNQIHANQSKQLQESGASPEPNPIATSAANLLVIAGGDDNYVYLYDSINSTTIERISSNGEHHTFSAVMPAISVDEKIHPLGIYARHGQILLHFAVVGKDQAETGPIDIRRCLLATYDTSDGALLSTYSVEQKFGSMLIGMSPPSYYFLSTEVQPGEVVSHSIVHAAP